MWNYEEKKYKDDFFMLAHAIHVQHGYNFTTCNGETSAQNILIIFVIILLCSS